MNPNLNPEEIRTWFKNPLINPRTGRTLDPNAKHGKFKLFCHTYAVLSKEECLAWEIHLDRPPKEDIPIDVFDEHYPLMPWFKDQCRKYIVVSHPITMSDDSDSDDYMCNK